MMIGYSKVLLVVLLLMLTVERCTLLIVMMHLVEALVLIALSILLSSTCAKERCALIIHIHFLLYNCEGLRVCRLLSSLKLLKVQFSRSLLASNGLVLLSLFLLLFEILNEIVIFLLWGDLLLLLLLIFI